MDPKEKYSFKDLDNKRNSISIHKAFCQERLEEVEHLGEKLRNYRESVKDSPYVYEKAILEFYDSEYCTIQSISKNIFHLDDELEENVQREKNKLNQLEEEIKRNEPKQQHKD